MTEPITPPIQEPKLELEKDLGKAPLLAFIFITHPPEIQLQNALGIIVLAYQLESAMAMAGVAKQKINDIKDWKLFSTGQKIPMTEFISRLYLDNIISSPPIEKAEIIEPPPEKIGLEKFKILLTYTAEDLIKDTELKGRLKEIIEKL